ncbi:MAG TPA: Vms1/Ankzf1 family peptidyl-tRNA hydrolase [Actinomycetota bacterium]|nr:Vms1/Ankzf1 family peptidyl-tRNA hydrolase [Actinomycetota bacterium]
MTNNDLDTGLRTLLERPGPFVSVYLDTTAETETRARELELRWRALRDRAEAAGAPAGALDAIDEMVSGVQQRAEGVAVFTAGDEAVLWRSLSASITDGIHVGPLPRLAPLLAWQQENPRFAVVTCDREGADIYVMQGEDVDGKRTITADQFPIQKVRAGGTAQRRIQQRAEDSWEANARAAARTLGRVVSDESLDLVVATGDLRALQFLREHLDEHIEPAVFDVEASPSGSLDDVADEIDQAVGAYAARWIEDTLARFEEAHGQSHLAVEGAGPTLEASRRAQVDTLLLCPDDVPDRSAWVAPNDLTQASLEKGSLIDAGVDDVTEAPLEDVLIRSALGTGAKVAILPRLAESRGPREGTGGILRYS